MTGANFYTYVLQEFKRTDKEDEAYEAMTDTAADMRRRMSLIIDQLDEYSTFSISKDQYIVELPVEFGFLVSDVLLEDTSGNTIYNPLNKLSRTSYDQKYESVSTGDQSGVPVDYCLFGDNVYVGPAFDSANYRLRLSYTPKQTADITSATTAVPFTDYHREIVRNGVVARLYKGMQNYKDAAEYFTLYQNGIGDMRSWDMANDGSTDDGVVYNGI